MIESVENRVMIDDHTGQVIPVEAPAEEEESEEEEQQEAQLQASPELQALLAQRAEQAGMAIRKTGTQVGRGVEGLLARVGETVAPDEQSSPPTDDLSDLFEGPAEFDSDVYIRDLVSVSEEDVFGQGGKDMSDLLTVEDSDIEAGEDDISDAVDVTEADVMGDDDPLEESELLQPLPTRKPQPQQIIPRKIRPIAGLSRLQR